MGFLGSGHCITMCGSLSMALGFSVPKHKSFVFYSTLISLGRVFGYALIGAVVSAMTQSVIGLTNGGILYLSVFASILMIGIGLHIAKVSNIILKTESLGRFIQPLIDPIKRKILPLDSGAKCLAYGLLWGFLPCGLVYTAITLAMSAESVFYGTLVMFCFGLGTVPTLVGLTSFNAKLNSILAKSYVRSALGGIVILLAVYQLIIALQKLQNF